MARPTSCPRESKNKVVGVLRISSFRTSSRLASASTSTCATSAISAVTSSMSNRVARHGPQKADENCKRVALEPKSAPIIAEVMSPLSDLTTTLPRERLCQKPKAVAIASTMTIGSKDFTGVVCLNGEGSATYEHSWR